MSGITGPGGAGANKVDESTEVHLDPAVGAPPPSEPLAAPPPPRPARPLGQGTAGIAASVIANRAQSSFTAPTGAPANRAGKTAYDRLPPEAKKALDDFRTGDDWGGDVVLENLIRSGAPDVAEAVADLLLAPDADASRAQGILLMLERSHSATGAKQLVRIALKFNDDAVSDKTLEALGRMGETGYRAVADRLATGKDDPRLGRLLPIVRNEAAASDPRVQTALLEAASAKDPDVAVAAARVLSDAVHYAQGADGIAFRHSALALMTRLARESKDPKVREAGGWAVFNMVQSDPGDPANLEALHRLAASSDPKVAHAVSESYATAGLMSAVNDDPALAAKALADLKKAAATLKGSPDVARPYAAMALIASKDARKHVLAQLDSKDPKVRAAAAHGVGQSDPGMVETLLAKAAKDPSKEVRAAALNGIRSLFDAGTEADQITVHAKLRNALKTATGEMKTAIEETLDTLKSNIVNPYIDRHHGSPPPVYDALVAAWDKKDMRALGEALVGVNRGEIKLFLGELPPGTTLSSILDDLRKSQPDVYKKVVDSFADQVSAQHELVDVGPAEVAPFRDALVDHFKKTDVAAVREFAERNLARPKLYTADPQRGAVDVLIAVGDDRSLQALLQYGPSATKGVQKEIKDLITAKRPADQVVRVAQPMLWAGGPGVSDVKEMAASALVRAGGKEGKIAAAPYYKASLAAKQTALDTYVKGTEATLKENMAKLTELAGMDAGLNWYPNILTEKGWEKYLAEKKALKSGMEDILQQREKLAGAITDTLENPDVQAALGTLPDAEYAEVLDKATEGIAGTREGHLFVQKQIVPALEKDSKSPFARAFGTADKVREKSLKLISKFAPSLAVHGDKYVLLGMQKVLGVDNKKAVEQLENALLDLQSGDPAAKKRAGEVVEKLGVKSAVNVLNTTFATITAVLAIQELAKDPSLSKALGAAKDTAGAVEALAKLAGPNNPHFQKLAKYAGGAGAAAGAVIGVYDATKAYDRKDVPGVVSGALAAAGGTMQVLALAGVAELAPIAPVVIAASLVVGTFKDSDMEEKVKEIAGKYGYEWQDVMTPLHGILSVAVALDDVFHLSEKDQELRRKHRIGPEYATGGINWEGAQYPR